MPNYIGNVVWFYRPLSAVLHQKWADICHLTLEEFDRIYHEYYIKFEDNSSNLEEFIKTYNFPDVTQFQLCLDEVYQPHLFKQYLNLPVLALIGNLHRVGQVGFLSNAENFFYPYIQKNFLPFFDFGYTSWELGVRKPDPKIYHLVLEKHDLQTSDVIFIDDTQKNVDAANLLGIKSIKFDDISQLATQLSTISLSD